MAGKHLLAATVFGLGLFSATDSSAGPLMFSMSGTINAGTNKAALNLGQGWIDLSGVAFTVTGLLGDPCCDQTSSGLQTYETTPTWDFGALGRFTMDRDHGITRTLQLPSDFFLEAWYPGTIDFQGLDVVLPEGLGQTFSDVVPLRTYTGLAWLMTNDNAEQLRFNRFDITTGSVLRINSVSVQTVPEPTTVLLMIAGLAGFTIRWRMAHRSLSTSSD